VECAHGLREVCGANLLDVKRSWYPVLHAPKQGAMWGEHPQCHIGARLNTSSPVSIVTPVEQPLLQPRRGEHG
jgi:hypothetical protein